MLRPACSRRVSLCHAMWPDRLGYHQQGFPSPAVLNEEGNRDKVVLGGRIHTLHLFPHLNDNILKRNFRSLSILLPVPNKCVRKATIYYIVPMVLDHLYTPDYYRQHPLFLPPPFFEVFNLVMVTSKLADPTISAKYKLNDCH